LQWGCDVSAIGGAVILSILAILISAATARNGTDFASLSQKIGPPKPAQSRIVVFPEQAYAGLI